MKLLRRLAKANRTHCCMCVFKGVDTSLRVRRREEEEDLLTVNTVFLTFRSVAISGTQILSFCETLRLNCQRDSQPSTPTPPPTASTATSS